MIGGTFREFGPKRNDKDFILLLRCVGGGEKHSNEQWIYEHGNIFLCFRMIFLLSFFLPPWVWQNCVCLFLYSSFHGKLIQYILLNLCLFAMEKNRDIESDSNLEDKALHEIWCKEKPKKFVMLFCLSYTRWFLYLSSTYPSYFSGVFIAFV